MIFEKGGEILTKNIYPGSTTCTDLVPWVWNEEGWFSSSFPFNLLIINILEIFFLIKQLVIGHLHPRNKIKI